MNGYSEILGKDSYDNFEIAWVQGENKNDMLWLDERTTYIAGTPTLEFLGGNEINEKMCYGLFTEARDDEECRKAWQLVLTKGSGVECVVRHYTRGGVELKPAKNDLFIYMESIVPYSNDKKPRFRLVICKDEKVERVVNSVAPFVGLFFSQIKLEKEQIEIIKQAVREWMKA